MTMIYNNTECCKNCSNNPMVNPYASGICSCTLPYVTPTNVRDVKTYTTDGTAPIEIRMDYRTTTTTFEVYNSSNESLQRQI